MIVAMLPAPDVEAANDNPVISTTRLQFYFRSRSSAGEQLIPRLMSSDLSVSASSAIFRRRNKRAPRSAGWRRVIVDTFPLAAPSLLEVWK